MRPTIPTPEELRRLPSDGGADFNRLVFEKSPYLLQHSGNPVDWYPWSDEAFDKARVEDRPVFLSIGYSTCHWCHVMEHESFEDDEVAELINRNFVAIKVDREEREDIDKIYMTVCVAITGQGGWPLTIILTPDGKPFFAGTYFPKSWRFGRPGLLQVLGRVLEAWKSDRPRVLDTADRIAQAIASERQAENQTLNAGTLRAAFEQLRSQFDWVYGGFGRAPKFPSPHNLCLLLRYSRHPDALRMVEQTLQAMRLGGIFDHIGFGFHRYSTDQHWLLPHFEKMLYDQAMLTIAYVEGFLATGNALLAQTAREVVAYVLRDMTSPEGGFYSAEDADSEGEEGRFYTWRIGDWDEKWARTFGFDERGNFEDQATGEKPGTNIPYLREPLDDPAWEPARQQLFHIREKRVHPHKDDKILTAWNGLMIAALAKAARALDDRAYSEAATRAADFILGALRRKDGRLLRRYRLGDAAIAAFCDDYACLAWGLLELYQTTFEERHLNTAQQLMEQMDVLFGDNGGYFFEGTDSEKLFMRKKDFEDGAIPSGNSIAALNWVVLSHLLSRPDYLDRASGIFGAASVQAAQVPMAFGQLFIALDHALGPSREIIIAGTRDAALLRVVNRRFLPRTVVMLKENDRVYPVRNGEAAAYVCVDSSCRPPVTTPDELATLLE